MKIQIMDREVLVVWKIGLYLCMIPYRLRFLSLVHFSVGDWSTPIFGKNLNLIPNWIMHIKLIVITLKYYWFAIFCRSCRPDRRVWMQPKPQLLLLSKLLIVAKLCTVRLLQWPNSTRWLVRCNSIVESSLFITKVKKITWFSI